MRELSLNVLDIAQNSITANASLVTVEAIESTVLHTLTLRIADNGKGMTQEQLEAVRDPFFTTRTTRKVGLGVPLFKMAAEMTGGTLEIEYSEADDHVDMTGPAAFVFEGEIELEC